jgi:predicted LPLAT superfamily acyltransferase
LTGAAPSSPAVEDGRPWTGRSRGGVVGNWIFVRLVRLFGVRPAYALLAFVACYYVLCAPQARRASAEYRRRLGYGGSSWLRRLWGAYRHFFSFGQLLLDRVAILAGRPGSFRFEFDGEEHMRAALQEGKGLVIVSAHCGNWEAAGHLLRRLEAPVNVVAYRGESAALRRFFEKALAEHSFAIIEADGSPDAALAIMAALARGEVVAMHGDRVLGDEGVVVPFLGAPARFPAGPHAVAALSGSPLIHAFAMRQGTYAYRFHAYPPERPRFGSRETRSELLREWVLRFVTRLESKLRDYPLQWCNFYPFWGSAT